MIYGILSKTHRYNPFIPKTVNGRKVKYGFISTIHLNDTQLDNMLDHNLINAGIHVNSYSIDIEAFDNYLQEVKYPDDYYTARKDQIENFREKALEHFVTLELINVDNEHVHIDVAAATSPFSSIFKQYHPSSTVYKQDLIYRKGLHHTSLGGYAHEIEMPDNSVDSVTLHCSLEHFEDDTDILFFQKLEKILKPKGVCIIAPFYIANEYTIHIDPVFNILKNHDPKIDSLAQLRYSFWKQHHSRHYDPESLQRRIINTCPELNIEVYRVMNYKDAFSKSYLRYMAVVRKKLI